MANVQRVKATVGKHDALAMALGTGEEKLEVFARLDFRFGFTHAFPARQIASPCFPAPQTCAQLSP